MTTRTQNVAALLALASMMVAQAAQAAAPAAAADLASKNGCVVGSVVSPAGQAVANAEVVLRNAEGQRHVARTNAEGLFEVQGVRPGVYQLTSGKFGGVVRVWDAPLAPPNSHDSALIVQGPSASKIIA